METPSMPNPLATESIDTRIAAAVQAVRQPRPTHVRPIVVIGAGGIVRAAHLPAYEKAGFPVIGLMDQDGEKAAALAAERRISHSFGSVAEAVRFAPPDAVFDVAVPASQLVRLIPQLPNKATVLIQKPMGETLQEARVIRDLCRTKAFTAAVNFSLRYSPNNLAVAALADKGLLGEIHDIEVQTSTYTPWHLWTFLATAPRLEILYHSIHYFDLIRSWLGNPQGAYARTVKNPQTANLAATKTIAILDYGNSKRVFVATNHNHNFGPEHQQSFVQWEGPNGAARITMGVNLDYPTGKPDTAEYAQRGSDSPRWRSVPVSGNNFPDAFMGTMGALQCFAEGSVSTLPSHFEDAFQTMALVEALYRSSELPGEPLSLD
jgi:predicted dehydrogenase